MGHVLHFEARKEGRQLASLQGRGLQVQESEDVARGNSKGPGGITIILASIHEDKRLLKPYSPRECSRSLPLQRLLNGWLARSDDSRRTAKEQAGSEGHFGWRPSVVVMRALEGLRDASGHTHWRHARAHDNVH